MIVCVWGGGGDGFMEVEEGMGWIDKCDEKIE